MEENQKSSSISVEKTASGKWVKSVKLYFDKDTENDDDIVKRIREIHNKINVEFPE
jgi:hypothetical protein